MFRKKLKFTKVDPQEIGVRLRYLGHMFIRFDELISFLGDPITNPTDRETSTFLWRIKIGKTPVEIYDFRQGRTHPFLLKKWHIRGENFKTFQLLTRLLEEGGIDTRRNHSFIL